MAVDLPEAQIVSAALVTAVDGAAVGGDFQLIEDVGPRTLAVVGDVTGNGEAAAPYADLLCADLRRYVQEARDAAGLLERLNTRVYDDPAFDRFTTACVVIVDRTTCEAQWAFAGHLPPHWLDNGMPIDGATPGLPLGIAERCGAISAYRRPLHPGEGMLLFTDGLEDVRGPGGDRFGSARITHSLGGALRGAPPSTIVSRLRDIACAFGDQKLVDDLCVLALRVT